MASLASPPMPPVSPGGSQQFFKMQLSGYGFLPTAQSEMAEDEASDAREAAAKRAAWMGTYGSQLEKQTQLWNKKTANEHRVEKLKEADLKQLCRVRT